MGLLDGDLQAQIWKGFKGKLLTGTLRRDGVPESGGLDSHGDPIDTTPTTWSIQGLVDNYTKYAKAQAGIPEADVKVLILAGQNPSLRPVKDDRVLLGGRWYQLRNASTDPAIAVWECQAFECEAPDGS